MAGKDLLETSLDADDLQSLSPSTREKLEGLISSLTLQRNEITAKYEKLRVNSGKCNDIYQHHRSLSFQRKR